MTSGRGDDSRVSVATMRADKWLWHARFLKTRTLAAQFISAGHLRINGKKVLKPACTVRVGDALTFPQGQQVRVVHVRALSLRRGPATEAQSLYEDATVAVQNIPQAPKFEGKGRPSGKDRRNARLYSPTRLD